MLSFIAPPPRPTHILTVHMDGLSLEGCLGKLAIVLVSRQRDWEAGVGRKLKFHYILSFTVGKKFIVYELFIFQNKIMPNFLEKKVY